MERSKYIDVHIEKEKGEMSREMGEKREEERYGEEERVGVGDVHFS